MLCYEKKATITEGVSGAGGKKSGMVWGNKWEKRRRGSGGPANQERRNDYAAGAERSDRAEILSNLDQDIEAYVWRVDGNVAKEAEGQMNAWAKENENMDTAEDNCNSP